MQHKRCADKLKLKLDLSLPVVMDVAVLDTQHNVGAEAAAGALLQQAAALQRRRHAR